MGGPTSKYKTCSSHIPQTTQHVRKHNTKLQHVFDTVSRVWGHNAVTIAVLLKPE